MKIVGYLVSLGELDETTDMMVVTDPAQLAKAINNFCNDSNCALDQVVVNPVLEPMGVNEMVSAALSAKYI